jgi:hypothetical protein
MLILRAIFWNFARLTQELPNSNNVSFGTVIAKKRADLCPYCVLLSSTPFISPWPIQLLKYSKCVISGLFIADASQVRPRLNWQLE